MRVRPWLPALFLVACGTTPSPDTHEGAAVLAQTAAGTGTASWTDRSRPFVGRIYSSIVDEPARRRVLLYGGFRLDTGVLRDTWEWDGFGWIARVPDDDPGPRIGAATVWDPIGQRVLLFGGLSRIDLTPTDQLLWEWNGENWASIQTEHAPPMRGGSSMVWDPVDRRVLLFGGFIGADGKATTVDATNDLWSFDGKDWTEVASAEPRPAIGGFGGMAYDARNDRFVVQPGYVGLLNQGGNLSTQFRVVPETWAWDRTTWRRLTGGLPTIDYGIPALAVEPGGSDVSLVVDTKSKSALYTLVDDVWTEQKVRPEKLALSSITWSTVDNAFFSTNGSPYNAGGSVDLDQIGGDYTVSSTADWRRRPTAVRPPARRSTGLAALPGDGRALMFGGFDGASTLGDTYLWDGGRWHLPTAPLQDAADRPAARAGLMLAALGPDRVLLFGGTVDGIAVDDTWIWSAATETWRAVARGASTPSPRRYAAMKPRAGGVVLFGGERTEADGSVSRNAETWTFQEPDGWVQRTPVLSPSPRSQMASTNLPDDTIRIYGGIAEGVTSGEEWSFDGTTWTLRGDRSPVLRRNGAMAADERSNVFLVGGTGSVTTPDVFDLTAEPTPLEPLVREDHQLPPSRRTLGSLVSNPRTGGTVLFAGEANESADVFDDTWQLSRNGASCTQNGDCGTGLSCTDGVCCEASSCGPCRSCAVPGRLGFCTARGTFGPEPGCDNGLACSPQGQCRRDNQQSCSDNAQCASSQCLTAGRDAGTCCAKEGCAVQCVNGALQQPDGTSVSCAPYQCEADRCKTTCLRAEECANGFVCTQEGACVLFEASGSEDGCGCRVAGAPASRSFGVALLALLAWVSRRRGRRR